MPADCLTREFTRESSVGGVSEMQWSKLPQKAKGFLLRQSEQKRDRLPAFSFQLPP